MITGVQQIQWARFVFAMGAALSILLGSIVASSPVAHAALHCQMASEAPHAHDDDASSSPDHDRRKADEDHGDCFLCEISSGRLVVDLGWPAIVPVSPHRASLVVAELTLPIASVDLRLPPILGPPTV